MSVFVLHEPLSLSVNDMIKDGGWSSEGPIIVSEPSGPGEGRDRAWNLVTWPMTSSWLQNASPGGTLHTKVRGSFLAGEHVHMVRKQHALIPWGEV